MTDEQRAWPPDPETDVVLDPRQLRALAHPLRIKIVGQLRVHGPSTATALAAQLGVNTGATSYHLRELAKAGMVVEDAERGNARDRWWRAAHRSSFLEDPGMLRDDPDAVLGYLRGVAQVNAEAVFRHVEDLPGLPPEWQEVATISDYGFHLTAGELKRLLDELVGVLAKYRSDEPRPGTRKVAVQLQAFPREEP